MAADGHFDHRPGRGFPVKKCRDAVRCRRREPPNRSTARPGGPQRTRCDADRGVASARLETQLSGSVASCKATTAPAAMDPNGITNYPAVAKLMMDMMLTANACGMANVTTFMFANADSWQFYPFATGVSGGVVGWRRKRGAPHDVALRRRNQLGVNRWCVTRGRIDWLPSFAVPVRIVHAASDTFFRSHGCAIGLKHTRRDGGTRFRSPRRLSRRSPPH